LHSKGKNKVGRVIGAHPPSTTEDVIRDYGSISEDGKNKKE
jgi:hypothetical protein